MQKDPILKVLCLRHGKTNYTGNFPDLTDEGLAEVTQVANLDVIDWMKKNLVSPNSLEIVSSPAPRAHGTADIIAQAIHHPKPILIEEKLNQMAWHNLVLCKSALGGLSGKGYINYEKEPIFADTTLFETQGEMRERWFSYLSDYICKAVSGEVSRSGILISHYEVFCHITSELFGIVASEETALKHVEPIELNVYELRNDHCRISGSFRNVDRIALFSLDDCALSLM